MDILTILIMTAAIAAIAARAVEVAVARPDAFTRMFAGARSFAESALEESAALRSKRQVLRARIAANDATAERPALAA